MRGPAFIEAYTIPRVALALGRSELNIRRWLQTGLIPAPILRETSRGLGVYSRGELEAIAEVLREHETEYAYYCAQHTATTEAIYENVQRYRAEYV